MGLLSAIASLSVIAGAYGAIGPNTNLYIKNKWILPDGFNRSTVLAGQTESSVSFPGPLISGFKGDTFHLNVIDQLTDTSMLTSTSVHWHGLFQEGTNWADGPVGVTQCPIAPGHSFLYQFAVPDQAGTFWYHSHHSTQYCDGLRGALVIYDRHDPHRSKYDFDDEMSCLNAKMAHPDCTPIVVANHAIGRPAGMWWGSSSVARRARRLSSCCPSCVVVIAGHGGGGQARAGPHSSLEERGSRRGVGEGAVESEKWGQWMPCSPRGIRGCGRARALVGPRQGLWLRARSVAWGATGMVGRGGRRVLAPIPSMYLRKGREVVD
ncbi:Cupredoxin [Pholiota molesta]|nr:Cupredoxin [Pholiota molesta]